VFNNPRSIAVFPLIRHPASVFITQNWAVVIFVPDSTEASKYPLMSRGVLVEKQKVLFCFSSSGCCSGVLISQN
jgi:hypothetical protein